MAEKVKIVVGSKMVSFASKGLLNNGGIREGRLTGTREAMKLLGDFRSVWEFQCVGKLKRVVFSRVRA